MDCCIRDGQHHYFLPFLGVAFFVMEDMLENSCSLVFRRSSPISSNVTSVGSYPAIWDIAFSASCLAFISAASKRAPLGSTCAYASRRSPRRIIVVLARAFERTAPRFLISGFCELMMGSISSDLEP